MTWLIGQLLGDLWPYLIWACGAIAALAAAYWRGGRNARLRSKNEALRGNIKTREKMDEAPHTSDPDTARERLRERDPDRR